MLADGETKAGKEKLREVLKIYGIDVPKLECEDCEECKKCATCFMSGDDC
jgi:hypothetical protein